MKIHPQVISQNGHPAFVVLPYDEYEKLLNKFDDLADIESIELSKEDPSERFPLDVVEAIASGNSPIKAFRQYRKISQTELAKRVGVTKQYISQLENKERNGTPRILKKIAKQLYLDLDDII